MRRVSRLQMTDTQARMVRQAGFFVSALMAAWIETRPKRETPFRNTLPTRRKSRTARPCISMQARVTAGPSVQPSSLSQAPPDTSSIALDRPALSTLHLHPPDHRQPAPGQNGVDGTPPQARCWEASRYSSAPWWGESEGLLFGDEHEHDRSSAVGCCGCTGLRSGTRRVQRLGQPGRVPAVRRRDRA